jgi:general stress protein 26
VTAPKTRLDGRFSPPGAKVTDWDATRHVLEDAELFWITTVRADGRPHVTPLVAVWLDDALHFTTGSDEQKAVNLRANPQVILTTGNNGWDEGLDVVVEGVASQVTQHDVLLRLAQAWTEKWDGRWQWAVGQGCFHDGDENGEMAPGEVLVFAVKPAKVLAFGKGNFSQTSHLF